MSWVAWAYLGCLAWRTGWAYGVARAERAANVPHVPLASAYRRHELNAAAERAVHRAVTESTGSSSLLPAAAPKHINGALDPADARALRGIPCIARGVSGTSPGTQP